VVIDVLGGGALWIDGALHTASATDAVPVLLAPGPHDVEVVGDKRRASETIVVPDTGPIAPVAIDVRPPALPPAPVVQKTKTIWVKPKKWVDLYVDGETRPRITGQTKPFNLTLTYGEHRLKFANAYAKPNELTVLVSDTDPPGDLVVDLEPLPARLLVTGAPPGPMLVRVAGKESLVTDRNRTDPILVPLAAGTEHDILVTKDGYRPFQTRLKFTPGRTAELAVALTPSAAGGLATP
jgi:hypothetical protein